MIDLFSASLAIRNYQQSSLTKNVNIVKRFLDWFGQDVQRLDTVSVEDYLMHMLNTGRSVKTAKNHLSAIKLYCDFLCRRRMLNENPAYGVSPLEEAQTVPVCLTDQEVNTAYRVGKQNDFLVEVTVALNTGLRMGELRWLRWDDVDLERKQIIVRKSKSKRPRTVPLNHITRTRLQYQMNQFGHLGYVFPGGNAGWKNRFQWDSHQPRGQNWWQKTSVKLLQKHIRTLSDLPPGRTGRGWHALRHTFATRAIRSGVDVVKLKDWMGHRQLDTTLRYIHVSRHYDPAIELIAA